MDVFFGVLLVIFLLLVLIWPYVSKWFGPALQRWMMGRIEDRMRRMAGMPTRKEERKMRRQAQKKRQGGHAVRDAFRDRRTGASRRSSGPIIPKEYAEDVEFVEMKTYSEETVITHDTDAAGKTRVKIESQIEDAEYVEIKD